MKLVLEKKKELLFWVLVVSMWTALYWKQCVIDNLGDFFSHNVFAKLIVEGKLILVYPGYHIPVGLIAKISGLSETQASVFVLTFAQVLSVIITVEILKDLSNIWKNRIQLLISSFLLNVVQPIFFYHYKPGASSGNGLFSPTLTMVKPFTLLAILLFYRMYRSNDYSFKNQMCFFLSLLACAFIKPMFLMAFVPAVGILLFVEYVNNLRENTNYFGHDTVRFITRVIPLFITGLVLIAQFVFAANYEVPYDVLPEGVNLSSDKNSHIRIGYMRSWGLAVDNVYISLLFTYFFPIIVLGIALFYHYRKNIKISEISREKIYPFRNITISYGVVSFLIMAFLYQEGREIDMNFRNAWVVTFNLVFIFSFVYIIELAASCMKQTQYELVENNSLLNWLKHNPFFFLAIGSFIVHLLFGAALITKYTIG